MDELRPGPNFARVFCGHASTVWRTDKNVRVPATGAKRGATP